MFRLISKELAVLLAAAGVGSFLLGFQHGQIEALKQRVADLEKDSGETLKSIIDELEKKS